MNERSTFIGSSDIAKLLQVSPWGGPVELWLDKTLPVAERTEPEYIKRGRRLEGYILDLAEEELGIRAEIRNTRYDDAEVPYFSCQLDAERGSLNENIEVKTVHPFKAGEWGDAGTDELPLHYLAQAQWGLGITRRHLTRFLVLIGDDLRQYVVERDDATIRAMRERATDFWERYVLAKVRPPMELDEHALPVLKRLYRGTNGEQLIATPESELWKRVLQESKGHVARYQAAADTAKAHLLDTMGEAALLKFEDGTALRRKLTKRKGYIVEDMEYMDARFMKLKE